MRTSRFFVAAYILFGLSLAGCSTTGRNILADNNTGDGVVENGPPVAGIKLMLSNGGQTAYSYERPTYEGGVEKCVKIDLRGQYRGYMGQMQICRAPDSAMYDVHLAVAQWRITLKDGSCVGVQDGPLCGAAPPVFWRAQYKRALRVADALGWR